MKNVFIEEAGPYDSLKHYGILGMKWGVRRYQNEDGSLTEAGKKRYNALISKSESYHAKIDKINAKLEKTSGKRSRKEAERLRLETKAASRRARATTAQYKAAMGKTLNVFDKGNLRRLHRTEQRLFKLNNYLNTPLSKIQKLEARDEKVQKQLRELMVDTTPIKTVTKKKSSGFWDDDELTELVKMEVSEIRSQNPTMSSKEIGQVLGISESDVRELTVEKSKRR